jgi:hypothetical protein
MQFDFFEKPVKRAALELLAHSSGSYVPRTGENARSADVTVAVASNFETGGERLTARVAGSRYVAIPYGTPVQQAAERLSGFLLRQEAKSLNVAGNGIYTLAGKGVSQAEANQYIYDVLRRVMDTAPLDHVRSGGQTGIDTAGLVAAYALGVPATGLYPKGYRRRNAEGEEVYSTAEELTADIIAMAAALVRK